MGMKRVWLEWTNINVVAGGRWELTLDQVLDCESYGSAYAIVTLQGGVTGAGGVGAALYTVPTQLTDAVGSARGLWNLCGVSAAVGAGGATVNQSVVVQASKYAQLLAGPPALSPPMGVLSLAIESLPLGAGTGTFAGNIRVLVCLKDPA